eukprot:CAMPEP_0202081062 /NCGR_PEP_ID=MMETSP0964-20121228/12024_1 /ASSEMBLY_ACC=CAM_ASM_000500 /TAXON_ID=4773 /ORGANISM="Schizochytrium aggregatum, Strain ATCC28209" /LENGTH=115 /DNA_ID=CAMNT_0048648571 /DNA_START=295 /DNA_END=639 /DNA_ORIENTATION=-
MEQVLQLERELERGDPRDGQELLCELVGAVGGLPPQASEDGHRELTVAERVLGHDLLQQDRGHAVAARHGAEEAMHDDHDVLGFLDAHARQHAAHAAGIAVAHAQHQLGHRLLAR